MPRDFESAAFVMSSPAAGFTAAREDLILCSEIVKMGLKISPLTPESNGLHCSNNSPCDVCPQTSHLRQSGDRSNAE